MSYKLGVLSAVLREGRRGIDSKGTQSEEISKQLHKVRVMKLLIN